MKLWSRLKEMFFPIKHLQTIHKTNINEKSEKDKKDKKNKKNVIITSQDIKAISGEDVLSTQLDLARAYIELGRQPLAKKILKHVVEHGTNSQQQLAEQMMSHL